MKSRRTGWKRARPSGKLRAPLTSLEIADGHPLPEDFAYKAFFDLARYPGETSDLNPYLVSAARFLNMHARNGVPAANMDLAVVVAGVRIYVCGQSMTFGGIDKSELAEPAQVALSAMTMLTVLQSEGYALLP